MAKGKKGGGGKGKVLTPEQQEAKAKKLLAKQQAKLQERKYEFDRDMVYSRANLKNLQDTLGNLSQNKFFNFIHGESMQRWKVFAWALRGKDKLISAFIEELENIEERRRIAQHMHLEIIDEIIRLYDEQVKAINKNYVIQRDKYARERFQFIMGFNQRSEKHLSDVLAYDYDMRLRCRDEQRGITTELMIRHALYQSREAVRKQELEYFFGEQCSSAWTDYSHTIKDYKDKTYEKRIEMTLISDREAASRRIMSLYSSRVAKLAAYIQVFQENYPGSKLKKTADYLRIERKQHRNAYEKIRDKINQLYEGDEKKLLVMSTHSSGTINSLKEACKKIEVLFKYMHLTHRFETEEEKTCVPQDFYQYFPAVPENGTLQLMRKLYFRRAQVTVQNEFLQKIYDQERERTHKLKKLVEYVIHNFDIGVPEVLNEDRFVMDKLYKI